MQAFSLYICDKIIRIETECGQFLRFCKGYLIKEPAPDPDYVITITFEEIEAQRLLSGSCGLGMLEGFVILNKLAGLLLVNEGILFMHGSVVAVDNAAYMFTAVSGVGKTTHSRLWLSNLSNAYILNGDKPFISTKKDVFAWGSPWCGAERYNKNKGVELKAICIMERANNNSISEISFEEALPVLSSQTGVPNRDIYKSQICILEALNRLNGKVRFYHHQVNNFKEDAFCSTYNVLSKL